MAVNIGSFTPYRNHVALLGDDDLLAWPWYPSVFYQQTLTGAQ